MLKINFNHTLRRLVLVIWLVGFFLTACKASEPEIVTIGVVNVAPILGTVLDGFKEGMSEFGYIENERVIYNYVGVVPVSELEAAVQALIDVDVDLILALSTPAAQAAQKLTNNGSITPILFVPVTDPVGAGLVESLRQPQNNITGIATGAAEARRLEWLIRLNPDIQSIYFPYNPDDSSPVTALRTLQKTAEELNVELVLTEVRTLAEVLVAIDHIPDEVEAIYIGPDALVGSQLSGWVEAALMHHLPISGSTANHVEAGMLFSYSYDPFAAGMQAARLADQIIRGVEPSDLPVETPEFFLIINLKTATSIGLDISDEILQQAAKIIRE